MSFLTYLHHSKSFTPATLLNTHWNLQGSYYYHPHPYPIYRGRNRGSERRCNLPKVTQLWDEGSGTEIWSSRKPTLRFSSFTTRGAQTRFQKHQVLPSALDSSWDGALERNVSRAWLSWTSKHGARLGFLVITQGSFTRRKALFGEPGAHDGWPGWDKTADGGYEAASGARSIQAGKCVTSFRLLYLFSAGEVGGGTCAFKEFRMGLGGVRGRPVRVQRRI